MADIPEVRQKNRGPMVRKPGARRFILTALAVVGVVSLVAVITFPLWFPRMARTFIPDQYMVAYAPEWLNEMVFNSERVAEGIPAAEVDDSEVDRLIQELEALPTATPTSQPEVTPTAAENVIIPPTAESTAQPTLPPTATPAPLDDYVFLQGFEHEYQGWNKCGPATLSTHLSFYGAEVDQIAIAEQIKPEADDRNVRPDELVAYATSQGYGAMYRVNGTIDLLRELLNAGYPVIVERGFDELEDEDWMGHYMLLYGYDDSAREFFAHDSYWGPSQTWSYDRLNEMWRHFSYTYIVVYPLNDTQGVTSIIGTEVNDEAMNRNMLERARDEVAVYDDAFAWYNLGAALTAVGEYENAATAFDAARQRTLPWRMYWYRFELYEAYYQVERYEDVLELTRLTTDVTNYPESEEGHYYMGLAYVALGQNRAAQTAFNRSLDINAGYAPARLALENLEG